MTPDEIRSIREYLGLSQVEAGELIGGGLRAFTKYEAGAVKPSASVVNLLRLLEADPTLIATMQGRKPRPVTTGSKFPFDVTGVDIRGHVRADVSSTLTSAVECRSPSPRAPVRWYPRGQQYPCRRRGRRWAHHMERRSTPHSVPSLSAQSVPVESQQNLAGCGRQRRPNQESRGQGNGAFGLGG